MDLYDTSGLPLKDKMRYVGGILQVILSDEIARIMIFKHSAARTTLTPQCRFVPRPQILLENILNPALPVLAEGQAKFI